MNIQGYGTAIAAGPGREVRADSRAPVFVRGESLRAEITGQNGPLLTLRGEDGRQFTALQSREQPMQPGQLVRLTVVGSREGVPVVELGGAAGFNLASLVESLDIQPTERNLALVREMAQAGLPVTRQSCETVLSALDKYPELRPEQAVFMAKQNIPVTAENVRFFTRLTLPSAQLGGLLERLLTALGGESQASNAPSQTAPQVPQTPVQTAEMPMQTQAAPQVQTPSHAQPQPTQGQPQAAPSQAAPQVPQTPPPTAQSAQRQTPEVPVQATPMQGQQAVEMPLLQTGPSSEAEAPQVQTPSHTQPQPTQGQPQTVPSQAAPQAPHTSPQIAVPQVPAPQVPQTPVQTAEMPLPMQNVPSQAVPSPAAPQVPVPQVLPQEQQENVTHLIERLFRKIDPQRAGKLPRELSEPRLARELSELLTKVERHAQTLPEAARETVREAARELTQSLGFNRGMQNFAAYAQIPVQIGDKKTTASVYVFNDSEEKKRIDPQNATMFLSLATANMDRVECFIKIVGKQVEADFSAVSEPAAELLRSCLPSLSEALGGDGFKLVRTAFGLSEKPSGPEAVDSGRRRMTQKYKFDRRV